MSDFPKATVNKWKEPWLSSSVGQKVIPLHQGCGFDPWSGHIQKSANGYINKWNSKLMFLSLSLSLFLSLFLSFSKTSK